MIKDCSWMDDTNSLYGYNINTSHPPELLLKECRLKHSYNCYYIT